MIEAFRHSHRTLQAPAVGLAILSLLSGPAFARINWVLKSNLPTPNEGNEQTCCVVSDSDGDLDILLKPYHHRAPRIDILLNAGPVKVSSGPG